MGLIWFRMEGQQYPQLKRMPRGSLYIYGKDICHTYSGLKWRASISLLLHIFGANPMCIVDDVARIREYPKAVMAVLILDMFRELIDTNVFH